MNLVVGGGSPGNPKVKKKTHKKNPSIPEWIM